MFAAFGCAFAGLAAAWRGQPNLRIHAVVAALVVVAGATLRIPPVWWALVALAIGLVVAAELLNTAIEAAVDLVTSDDHPLAKRAKDVAAGAVLVAVLTALGIGLALGVWLTTRR